MARTFTASHVYPGGAATQYAIDLTLTDDDGGVGTAQVQVVVSTEAAVIESVSATAAVDENGLVTVSGSFSDTGSLGSHALTIAWGRRDDLRRRPSTWWRGRSRRATPTWTTIRPGRRRIPI